MDKVSEIPNLTPVRGMAALLVIFFHYDLFIAKLIPDDFSPAQGKLYLMVDLFFVLSGFVIYHVYGQSFKQGVTNKNLFTFLGARFARIYPLHLFSLLLLIAIAGLAYATQTVNGFTQVVYDFAAIPQHLLMLQSIGTPHEATWNTPSWSIGTEWWAYVAFPFIAAFLARSKAWARWLLIALILAGYFSITFYFQPQFWAARWAEFNVPDSVPYPMYTLDVITGSAFIRCLCGFCWGMMLYELFIARWNTNVFASGYVFVGCWAALFILWHVALLPDVLAVFIMGLLIYSAACNNDWLTRTLNNKFWQHMGDISYSLYLVHMPLILGFFTLRGTLVNPDPLALDFGYKFTPPVAWLGLLLLYLISIGFASVTYHYLERPARKYLRQALANRQNFATAPE